MRGTIRGKGMIKNNKVKNAIMLGTLCSVSYLGVYLSRNILSTVTPQIIESGRVSTEYIGFLSSLFFAFYAVGQLINGVLGERVKARYMLSFGLLLAGLCNLIFPVVLENPLGAYVNYGLTGFFLSMIFAPMTKVVAENTEPIYATRCSLGYEFGSLLGSPLAGVIAAILVWQSVFHVSGAVLVIMGILCFVFFLYFEKKGIVKYNQYEPKSKNGNNINVLIEHRIIKFTLISIITGIVRTSVVFWMPTYISQYLGFSAKNAATIFTIATLFISLTTFVAVFLYEKLHRNMDLTILIVFISAAISFLFVYLIKLPVVNIVFFVLAIMSSNCAASMLWSRYCPSLRDTGMVSTATGFLDFISYMAAAASSTIFANAVTAIGWQNLILIWIALMIFGIAISIPWKKLKNNG